MEALMNFISSLSYKTYYEDIVTHKGSLDYPEFFIQIPKNIESDVALNVLGVDELEYGLWLQGEYHEEENNVSLQITDNCNQENISVDEDIKELMVRAFEDKIKAE